MQGSWKQIATKFLTSWKKCGGKLEKVCTNVLKNCALRKYSFVQCVEKVCANVQKMRKLAKCKAVQMRGEVRTIFV